MNTKYLIQKMMSHYDVFTMKELAEKIGISQQAISKWNNNDSIIAIKKRCKKLGIYDKIFKDFQDDINSIHDFIDDRDNFLKKEVDLFKNLDFEYNFSEKIIILEANCKKYNIQITEIKNLRMLYLFEQLLNDATRINKVNELEEDIKKLMLKYDPRLAEDEQTTNLFYNFLEEQIKKFEDKFKK